MRSLQIDPLALRAQALRDGILRTTPHYPAERFSGRGIVTCTGNISYFTCAWVCINLLRRVLGCTLPIQAWYLGPEEMSPRMVTLLEGLGVECVDAYGVCGRYPMQALQGYGIKAYAVVHSRFEEVIFLDADNVPLADPVSLFSHPEYERTGAIFWPDLDSMRLDRRIWDICRIPFRNEPAFETGQMVIDKKRCWMALVLTLHMNELSDFYYQYMNFDTGTWHMAWRMLNQPFSMPPYSPHLVPFILNQYDFEGRTIFQHRCGGGKWTAWGDNPQIEGFEFEDECQQFLDELRPRWNGRVFIPTPVGLDRDGLSPDEEIVQTRWFVYCRIGSDQRLLEFLPDHTIGQGSGLCEQEWYAWEEEGERKLALSGTFEGWLTTTCELSRHADGVWRGRWLHSEKMPVELIPEAAVLETDHESILRVRQQTESTLSWCRVGR